MLFNKKIIKCQTQNTGEGITHRIEYYHALSHIANVRYEIIKGIIAQRALILDIDTSLFMPSVRLSPTEYIEWLQQKLKVYGFHYKIRRTQKEVMDSGIGRMFSMKPTKLSTAYSICIYMENKDFTLQCYQDLFENIGYRICVVKEESDPEELLELFYSGMIEDKNLTDLFYAHFYCNEQLTQLFVNTHHIDKEEMNRLLDEMIKNHS